MAFLLRGNLRQLQPVVTRRLARDRRMVEYRAMRRFVLLACATLVVRTPCTAQETEELPESNIPGDPFASALYTYDFAAQLDASGAEEGEVAAREGNLWGSLPVLSGEALSLFVGAALRWNRFEFENAGLDDIDVYAVTVPFDLVYEADLPLSIWLELVPGVFSDLDETDLGDVQTLAQWLASYQCSPALALSLGAAHSLKFGESRLYPMGGVTWTPNEEWEFDFFFPMPRVSCAPADRFVLFAQVEPAGDLWSVTVDGEPYDFSVENWRIGAGFEYELFEGVWLQAAAGMDVAREYEVFQHDEAVFKSSAEDAPFVRIGLLAR